jgi:hypothetical protein
VAEPAARCTTRRASTRRRRGPPARCPVPRVRSRRAGRAGRAEGRAPTRRRSQGTGAPARRAADAPYAPGGPTRRRPRPPSDRATRRPALSGWWRTARNVRSGRRRRTRPAPALRTARRGRPSGRRSSSCAKSRPGSAGVENGTQAVAARLRQPRTEDPHELGGRRRPNLGPRVRPGGASRSSATKPSWWAAAFSDPATRTAATTPTSRSVARCAERAARDCALMPGAWPPRPTHRGPRSACRRLLTRVQHRPGAPRTAVLCSARRSRTQQTHQWSVAFATHRGSGDESDRGVSARIPPCRAGCKARQAQARTTRSVVTGIGFARQSRTGEVSWTY